MTSRASRARRKLNAITPRDFWNDSEKAQGYSENNPPSKRYRAWDRKPGLEERAFFRCAHEKSEEGGIAALRLPGVPRDAHQSYMLLVYQTPAQRHCHAPPAQAHEAQDWRISTAHGSALV